MDLIHPLVLEIGMPVLAALFLALHLIRKKTKYTTGKKVSNTSFLKELPIYKKRKKLYQGTAIAIEILLVIALAMSLLMMSRPAIKQTTSNGTKKRDIFLCMDVSYSICDLNYELVESLKGVVEGLDGDRFGISIYNTTTVLYVPMTDDYDFIIEKLDELHNYFDLQKQYLDEFGEYIYLQAPATADAPALPTVARATADTATTLRAAATAPADATAAPPRAAAPAAVAIAATRVPAAAAPAAHTTAAAAALAVAPAPAAAAHTVAAAAVAAASAVAVAASVAEAAVAAEASAAVAAVEAAVVADKPTPL